MYKLSRLLVSCALLIGFADVRLQGFDLATNSTRPSWLSQKNPFELARAKRRIRKSPGNFELWLDLAGIYLSHNRLDKVRSTLDSARKKGAKGLRFEHLFGRILSAEGKYKQANQHLFQALVLSDQEEPLYFVSYAKNALLGKEYIQGLRWTTLGLKLHPAHPDLLVLYGYLFLSLGRFQEAEVALIKARELKKKDPYIPFNLACIYAIYKDSDACLFHLRKAVLKGYAKTYRLRLNPVFDFLRGHPQFQLAIKQARQNETRQRPRFSYRAETPTQD